MEQSSNNEDTEDASSTGVSRGNATRGGVICLGHEGVNNVVLSVPRGCVVKLSPRDMTKTMLLTVAGPAWAFANFPAVDEKTGDVSVDVGALMTYINEGCVRAGPFSDGRYRAAGIWPTTDGELIVSGSAGLWRSDGKPVVEHVLHEGWYYPANHDYDLAPDTPTATPEDVEELESFLDSWVWRHESEKMLVQGWLAEATVAAALPERPGCDVTASSGTGKSVVRDTTASLLGQGTVACDGKSTEAGTRQKLGGRPAAVQIDETEGDGRNNLKVFVEMSRSSYSDGGDGVLRGTSGGKAQSFPLRSAFMLCRINPAPFEPSDLSRWVEVEMKEQKPDAKLNPHPYLQDDNYCRQKGLRLRRLVVARWHVLRDSLKVIHHVIVRETGDSRMAATLAPLLAGYWCLHRDTVADELDAHLMYGGLELARHEDAHAASDEANCLEAILSWVGLFTTADRAGCATRLRMSVGQAIRRACLGEKFADDVSGELQNLGLRVVRNRGTWCLCVVASRYHQGVTKLFKGTTWASGGWSKQLARVEGAERDQQRVGSISLKVVRVPLPADLFVGELSARPSSGASSALGSVGEGAG